jgi:hypothetical protein
MTIKSKLQGLLVLQLAAFCLLMFLFSTVVNWLTVIPREEAVRRGMSVPSDWRLVTIPFYTRFQHGEYREWKFGTVGEHPFMFTLCILALIVVIVFIKQIRKYGRDIVKDEPVASYEGS